MSSNAALLIIDVQQGFDDPCWGQRNNIGAENNIGQLLHHWRAHSRSIIHIQHSSTEKGSPLERGQPGFEYKEIAQPTSDEPCFCKSTNSAFVGTGLKDYLKRQKIESLVIAGLTTDHCVSTTVRVAANNGLNVILAEDATATFGRTDHNGIYYSAQTIHAVNVASLQGEFCRVSTTAELLLV